jgi:FkbM family methyltransferase
VVTRELFTNGAVVQVAGHAILYGAGSVGRDVCRVLTDRGIRVECILDRQATNRGDYRGVPIRTPDACPVDSQGRFTTPVVLTIFNRDVDIPQLAQSMHALGFSKVVSFPELHAVFPEQLGDRFWLTRRGFLDANAADIAEVDRLWTDAASRTVYRSFIALRQRAEFDDSLRPAAGQTHYFPEDIPGWPGRRPMRFVDCGAYRGDTLQLILDRGLPLEASAHFEPDLDNFSGLAAFVRAEHLRLRGPAQLWPCAVSDRSTTVCFQQGAGEASGISETGGTTVTAVALDDVLVGWHPTLIKMDIEGAEVEALQGSRRAIAEARPALAVSVYHRPDHLWRIPLLLSHADATRSYEYYLRVHGFNGFDAVLYALPRP